MSNYNDAATISESDDLREKLDALNVSYHHRAGIDKLRKLYAAAAPKAVEEPDPGELIPPILPRDPGTHIPRSYGKKDSDNPAWVTPLDRTEKVTDSGWMVKSNGSVKTMWCPQCDHSMAYTEYPSCVRCTLQHDVH